MKKIHIIHGPHLDRLGDRERGYYGGMNLVQLNEVIYQFSEKIGLKVEIFQSNSEVDVIGYIREASTSADGLIINPAGMGYSSLALRDAVIMCEIPVIEVHLSNIHGREVFRQRTIIADVCEGQISGFKHLSYIAALTVFQNMSMPVNDLN